MQERVQLPAAHATGSYAFSLVNGKCIVQYIIGMFNLLFSAWFYYKGCKPVSFPFSPFPHSGFEISPNLQFLMVSYLYSTHSLPKFYHHTLYCLKIKISHPWPIRLEKS